MKRYFLIPVLALALFSCEKDEQKPAPEPEPVIALKPVINCGEAWSDGCIDASWDVSGSALASLTVLPDGYNGRNSILLYNPHDSLAANPQPLRLNTFIKNIKKDAPYKISFYSKIKGFPDVRSSNPSLAAYAFTQDDWYNEVYYGSEGGKYHDKDWSKHSFTIIGKDAPTINFELYSLYDSTWISDLKIEAM